MKYWLFQNNQVNGPYAAEELRELSSFSAESLVCPEGRKGTSMGDWQRAGIIAELAACFLKTPQLTVSGNFASGSGGLPPDPTLKDLAALGGLKEKVGALESSVSQLWEDVRLKESEIAGLNADLAEKKRQVEELQGRLAGMEEKVHGVSVLRENLDKAVAAEKNVETAVETQGRSLFALSGEVSRLKTDFRGIDQLKAEVKELAGLKADLQDFNELKDEVKEIGKNQSQPKEAQAPAPVPAPEISKDEPVPVALSILEVPADLPPRVEAPPPTVELPREPAPSPAPAPVVDIAAPADAGKFARGKAKKFMAAGAAAVITLSAAAYFSGLLSPKKTEEPAAVEEPLPEEAAPAPQAAQEEQRKAAALNLVKMFPSASGAGTLDEQLQGPSLEASGLSPWLAEKISEGVYQVNFYSPKNSAAAPAVTYEFEVRLVENKVAPHNEAATHLMAGTKPAPAPAPAPVVKKRKRVKVKPKPAPVEEASVESLFPEDAPAQSRAEPEAEPASKNPEPGDDFIDYSLGAEPAQQKVPVKTRKQQPLSEKPDAVSDADLLDDLLKP